MHRQHSVAIFSALFSYLMRQLGTLVRILFGWSVTGLFGRLPSTKQTALSAAMLLSLFWPLLAAGIFAPVVMSWAISFAPVHQWLGPRSTRILWCVLALLVPIGVGAIARWVAPSHKTEGSRLRALWGGYPITLGFFAAFVITLVAVPTLRGERTAIARMRAQLIRQPLERHAMLVGDPAAQRIEDELGRMWALWERHRDPSQIGRAARSRLKEIARELDDSHLPFDQWILLYAGLSRLEGAIAGGPALVDPHPPEGKSMNRETEDSLPQLVRRALDESRELARLEIALARKEMKEELAAAKRAGISLGVGGALAICGVTMLLVTIALAFSPTWLPALLVGVIVLAAAGIATLVGYKSMPRDPLGEARRRATDELHMLKEHSA